MSLPTLYDRVGPESLSDADVLSVALGSAGGRSPRAIAADLLDRAGSLAALSRLSPRELEGVPGLGRLGAVRLHAALTLGRRSMLPPPGERPVVRHPLDALRLLGPALAESDREEVHTLFLNGRMEMLTREVVSIGGRDAAVMDPRVILTRALHHRALALIVAHNHPSGDPPPSRQDEEATRELAEACRVVQIPLRDHLVIASGGWRSLAAAGLLGGLGPPYRLVREGR